MAEVSSEVLIVGAGPTGLMLAGQLAVHGARVVVIDRAARPDDTPKGNGLVGHAAVQLRRLGVLDGTGLRVIRPPRFRFGPLELRLGFGPGNPLHLVAVPQRRLERILEQRAVAGGVRILRGQELVAFDQSEDSVTALLRSATADSSMTAAFLVGCDGARSTVRKHAGIGFPGFTSDTVARIARVTIPDDRIVRVGGAIELPGVGRFVPFRPNRAPGGRFSITPAAALDPAAPRDLYIIATHEPRGQATSDDALPVDELNASLTRVLGADLPFTTAAAVRATIGNSRQADAYVQSRVLLAGDAAHIFDAGGSSINAGLLDAFDVAPRLAATLTGAAPVSSLADYDTARRSACDRTLAHTRLQAALDQDDELGHTLRTVIGPLLRSRRAARSLARIIEAAPEQA